MAMIFVFLVLAAQYESWAVPFSVLLGLPIGVFGAFLGVSLVGLENNVYVQIGIVTLMGLAAKNAILIVEFAKEYHERKGMSLVAAAVEGARLRFRPIMMTAFAFILGVVPLVIASGAGAAARISIGIAVFAGMLMASTVGLFFIPMLYVLIQRGAYLVTGNKTAIQGTVVPAEPALQGGTSRDAPQSCSSSVWLQRLTGCTVGPNYKRPDVPAPPQFRAGGSNSPHKHRSATSSGSTSSRIEVLRDLINEALQANYDIRIAAQRVVAGRRPGCPRPGPPFSPQIGRAGGRRADGVKSPIQSTGRGLRRRFMGDRSVRQTPPRHRGRAC